MTTPNQQNAHYNALECLDLAKATAIKAGEALEKKIHGVLQSSARDSKLVADTESEKLILQNLRPTNLPILSEESAKEMPSGPLWIVDPLDGSVNYERGIPMSAISIALWDKGEPQLGVIYDFSRKELFYASAAGAFLNETPIKVSDCKEPSSAILFTGFPNARDYGKESLQHFVSCVQDYKKIRLLGSAALSLAYVAAGRGDAYFENSIRLWDVAAGVAMVKFAGGRIKKSEVLTANNMFTLDLYADNGHLRTALM